MLCACPLWQDHICAAALGLGSANYLQDRSWKHKRQPHTRCASAPSAAAGRLLWNRHPGEFAATLRPATLALPTQHGSAGTVGSGPAKPHHGHSPGGGSRPHRPHPTHHFPLPLASALRARRLPPEAEACVGGAAGGDLAALCCVCRPRRSAPRHCRPFWSLLYSRGALRLASAMHPVFQSSRRDFTFGPWKLSAARTHIMKSAQAER